MEVLILLSAGLFAVPDALALALDKKNVSLIAELALSNMHATFIFVFKGKFGRTHF